MDINSKGLLLQYTVEALFRSEQYALVDNACREYLFVTEFFMVRAAQAQDLFNQIMGKTLTLMIVSFINWYKKLESIVRYTKTSSLINIFLEKSGNFYT